MNLITPARDCTDSELDARIAYLSALHQPQQSPQPDYTLHTAECATDEDGPAGPVDLLSRIEAKLYRLTDPPWPARGALALLIVLWIALGAVFLYG